MDPPRLNEIADALGWGYVELDSALRCRLCSDTFAGFLSTTPTSLVGLYLDELLTHRNRPATESLLRKIQSDDGSPSEAYVEIGAGSVTAHCRVRIVRVSDGWQLVAEDSLAEGNASFPILLDRERLREVVYRSGEGVAFLDTHYRVLGHNEAFRELMDFRSVHGATLNDDGVAGRNLLSLLHDDHFAELRDALARGVARGKPCTATIRHADRDLAVEIQAATIRKLGYAGYSAVVRDIGPQVKLEHALRALERANLELERLARTDPLTLVLNRRGFEHEFAGMTNRARRFGWTISALLIDCDNFKSINSRYGHAGGDVVLKEVAARLRSGLRETDLLGRVGGDEFLVMLPATELADAINVANKIRSAVATSVVHVGKQTLGVTVSVGVTVKPVGASSIAEVLPALHQALEMSKTTGKNQVCSTSIAESDRV